MHTAIQRGDDVQPNGWSSTQACSSPKSWQSLAKTDLSNTWEGAEDAFEWNLSVPAWSNKNVKSNLMTLQWWRWWFVVPLSPKLQTALSRVIILYFLFNFSNYQAKYLKACQVSRHHVKFEESCPSGSMTLEKFVELSRDALGDQADFLSEALFRFLWTQHFSVMVCFSSRLYCRLFDDDQSGSLEFNEYMLAIRWFSNCYCCVHLTMSTCLHWVGLLHVAFL